MGAIPLPIYYGHQVPNKSFTNDNRIYDMQKLEKVQAAFISECEVCE